MFVEADKKFIENHFLKSRIKNLQCLLYRNVADIVSFQEHFIALDYLDWFSSYEQFCEPRYL